MQPTKMQTLMLWALLAKGGQGYARDLKPPVAGNDRKALIAAGLIRAEKRAKGAYWLEISDRGWAWSAGHLGDELSGRTTNGTFVLREWLLRLQDFMKSRNIALAEILAPRPAEQAPAAEPLRARIRGAYLQVTGGAFNQRALLSRLREALADVGRDQIDTELRQMHREDGTTLMALDNPREITPAERNAALDLGGESMHILWIRR